MGNGDRLLIKEYTKPGVKRLTSSSSRSTGESAFMMEPLFASRRSVGLTKNNGKRGESDQQERGVNGECVGRTLGVDWGMKRGSNDCRYRRSQWGSQRRLPCTRQGRRTSRKEKALNGPLGLGPWSLGVDDSRLRLSHGRRRL